jgi:16S rRNA pseudouridine516 synthase
MSRIQRATGVADVLFSQGFGTRRLCAALVLSGRVRVQGAIAADPDAAWLPQQGEAFAVDGSAWTYHLPALLMLHKPAGFECSARPQAHPSVLSLLPEPLRTRGVQPVGRLDADTTGLLLLTDDGPLSHRLTSPRHHVPKGYRVTCKHPVSAATTSALLQGVRLRDEPGSPARALHCQATGPAQLDLVIAEGRYHQVKRMVAAAGNRVQALHRFAFGALTLPDDLGPGEWRWVEAETALAGAASAAPEDVTGSHP